MSKLTAKEVANKTFSPVRLREGYSIDEVDTFLDQVESTLSEHEDEINSLRSLKGGPPVNTQELDDLRRKIDQLTAQNSALETKLKETELDAASGNASQDPTGTAAKLLEMAAQQHDTLVEQGKSTADRIVREAEAKIAEERAALDAQRYEVLGNLENEKRGIEGALHRLRELEVKSKEELTKHFSKKLEELDGFVSYLPEDNPRENLAKSPEEHQQEPPSVESEESQESSRDSDVKPQQAFPSFFGESQ